MLHNTLTLHAATEGAITSRLMNSSAPRWGRQRRIAVKISPIQQRGQPCIVQRREAEDHRRQRSTLQHDMPILEQLGVFFNPRQPAAALHIQHQQSRGVNRDGRS